MLLPANFKSSEMRETGGGEGGMKRQREGGEEGAFCEGHSKDISPEPYGG